MKKLILSTVALSALALPALAADLPSRTMAPVFAAPAPIFTWTGFYVGANAGYGFGQGKASDIALNGTPFPSRNGSFDTDGAIGGGQIGYNYQIGSIVLGLEADLQASGVKGSYVDDPLAAPASASHINGKLEYFGTVRARAGYAVGNALFYATGGFAYGSTKASITNFINQASPVISSRANAMGYALGGGVEYALTRNWTVKAEYLYLDLGKKGISFAQSPVVATAKDSSTTNVVRLGVNYKF